MEATSIRTLVSATISQIFISFATRKFCLQVVQQVFHENRHPDICYLRVYTNFYLYIPQFLSNMDAI